MNLIHVGLSHLRIFHDFGMNWLVASSGCPVQELNLIHAGLSHLTIFHDSGINLDF